MKHLSEEKCFGREEEKKRFFVHLEGMVKPPPGRIIHTFKKPENAHFAIASNSKELL